MKNISKHIFFSVVILLITSFKSDTLSVLIAKKHTFFTIDNLGNSYLCKESELVKYLNNGNYFARYSNLNLGEISSVDATNGLKILVFYKDYQQIVFLDNQLTQKNAAISLEKLGYEQTELACNASNNGFWLYNKSNNDLIRFDNNLKKTVSTGNLSQLLQTEIKPNFMVEHNGYLFLNSPDNGLFMFDVFGTFIKLISLKNLKDFQITENIVYFLKDNKLCSYNFKLFDEACKDIELKNAIQARVFKEQAFISNGDTLIVN